MALSNLHVTAEQPHIWYEAFDPRSPDNLADVERIIRWSVRESMVPISHEAIAKHQVSHVARVEDQVAGYGAITHIYSGDVVELGSIVVGEKYRKLGIASGLVGKIVAEAHTAISPKAIYAWSNPTSATLFTRLGGEQVEDANTLPQEVWKLCHTCRFYDEFVENLGQICCGRVYDVTDISNDHRGTA